MNALKVEDILNSSQMNLLREARLHTVHSWYVHACACTSESRQMSAVSGGRVQCSTHTAAGN